MYRAQVKNSVVLPPTRLGLSNSTSLLSPAVRGGGTSEDFTNSRLPSTSATRMDDPANAQSPLKRARFELPVRLPVLLSSLDNCNLSCLSLFLYWVRNCTRNLFIINSTKNLGKLNNNAFLY